LIAETNLLAFHASPPDSGLCWSIPATMLEETTI
jgi:hypothetical protein